MIVNWRTVRLTFSVVALVPSIALGQRVTTEDLQRQVDSLQRRTAELERRLNEIEAILRGAPNRAQNPSVTPGARELANWRRLRNTMTMDQVRALLGEPDNVNAGPRLVIWSYPDFGSVTFVDGNLNGWVEPRRP